MQWTETNGYRRYGTKNARVPGSTDWSLVSGTLTDETAFTKLQAAAGSAEIRCEAFSIETPSWIHLRVKTSGMAPDEYFTMYASALFHRSDMDIGERAETRIYADRLECWYAPVQDSAVTEVGSDYLKFDFYPTQYRGAYIRVKDGAGAGGEFFVTDNNTASPGTMWVGYGANPQLAGVQVGDHVDVVWMLRVDTTDVTSLLLHLFGAGNGCMSYILVDGEHHYEVLRLTGELGANRICFRLDNAQPDSVAAIHIERLGVERPRPDGSIAADTFPDELKLDAASGISRVVYSATPMTKHPSNPIMAKGQGWATTQLYSGTVMEDGGDLRMAVRMQREVDGVTLDLPGIAVSATKDGFSVPDSPCIDTDSGLDEVFGLYAGSLWKEPDGQHAMLLTQSVGNNPYRTTVCVATSDDGQAFTPHTHGPVLRFERPFGAADDQVNPSDIIVDAGLSSKRDRYRVFGQSRGGGTRSHRGVLMARGEGAWSLQLFPWGELCPIYNDVHNANVIRRSEDDWLLVITSPAGTHPVRVARGRAPHVFGPFINADLIAPSAGEWDASLVFVGGSVAREAEGEFWIYYCGTSGGANGIGLATCRIDGFDWLALDDGQTQGTATTIALSQPSGGWGELRVNVDASAAGSKLEAAVIDPGTGQEVPGYGLADCDDVTVDSTDHHVTWNGADLSGLAAAECQLRFQLSRAAAEGPSPALYAYRVNPASQAKPTAADLKAEGQSAPTAVTDPTPEFSWTYAHPESLPQAAYRIIVCSSLDRLEASDGDIWDSGEVAGSDTLVSYAGPSLSDETAYYWKVRVKSSAGVWSDW